MVTDMRTLAAQYPRYGYRRIHVFLRRKGHALGVDRVHRLWRTTGLQVPRKRPRRRAAAHRPRPTPPMRANHVWAYDFLFDACANGQALKCLTIVDEWTRECLAIDVAGSLRSRRVIEVLTRLVSLHGAPRYLRSDNGPEFVSSAILRWITESAAPAAIATTPVRPATGTHRLTVVPSPSCLDPLVHHLYTVLFAARFLGIQAGRRTLRIDHYTYAQPVARPLYLTDIGIVKFAELINSA